MSRPAGPAPQYIVRHTQWNRATRRKANRLARREGLTVEPNTINQPYRRPTRRDGQHLARLAELEDAGQLQGRPVIVLEG